MATADIVWADQDDVESPERLEALAAASDILTILGVTVGGAVQARIVERILWAVGASYRRSYDLGWRHCQKSLRE